MVLGNIILLPKSSWEINPVPVLLQPEEELKKQLKINKIIVEDNLLGNVKEQYSSLLKVKRIIALLLKMETDIEPKKKVMSTR